MATAASSSSSAAPAPLEGGPAPSDGSQQATELTKRLFVLVATNRQSFPRRNSALACDRDTLLERLRQVEEFASTEMELLLPARRKGGKDSPSSPALSSASELLTRIKTQVANERKWKREDSPDLAQRLTAAIKLAEAGFSVMLCYLSSSDAEAALNAYSSSRGDTHEAAHRGSGGREVASSAGMVSFTPSPEGGPGPSRRRGLAAITPSTAAAAAATTTTTRKRTRSGSVRSPVSAEEHPLSHLPRRPDWSGVVDVIYPYLVGNLDRESTASARLVCTSWRRQLDHAQEHAAPYGSADPVRLAATFPNLTSLDLGAVHGQRLCPDHFLVLANAYGNKLQTLRLSHCVVEAFHLPFFARFRALTLLDLSRCALLATRDLLALPAFLGPSLTSLNLAHSTVDDDGLRALAQRPAAVSCGVSAALEGCLQVSSSVSAPQPPEAQGPLPRKIPQSVGIPQAVPPQFAELQELDLSGCKQVTSDGIAALAESAASEGLRVLRIRDCDRVDAEGVSTVFEHLSELRELDLGGLNDVTDETMRGVTALTKLESLSVGSQAASGFWLPALMRLPELQHLSLKGCNELTDHMFEEQFPEADPDQGVLAKLTSLDMSFCSNVGGRGTWLRLQELPVLANLDLSYSCAGGSGMLDSLENLESLENLSLEGCHRINDKCLDVCVRHPGLKRLNVRGCSCLGYYGILAMETSDIEFAM